MKQYIINAFKSALKAVDPIKAVKKNLSVDGGVITAGGTRLPIKSVKNIYVAGAGKASVKMGQGALEVLGNRIAQMRLIAPKGCEVPPEMKQYVSFASHPVPDESSVEGSNLILKMAQQAGEGDLFLFLLSGGASSLMALPDQGHSLEEVQQKTEEMLRAGASIREINAVRKELSAVKGGKLALAACPAHVASIIISDVEGDDISVIGSGPTVYHEGQNPCCFSKVTNLVAADNKTAVSAASEYLTREGFYVGSVSEFITGEASSCQFISKAAEFDSYCGTTGVTSRNDIKGIALVGGGENTVTVKGSGCGGRCHEAALSAFMKVQQEKKAGSYAFGFLGTDGKDGTAQAAGAVFDCEDVKEASHKALQPEEYMKKNDSFTFFDKLGCSVKTGLTGTNVNDLFFYVRKF